MGLITKPVTLTNGTVAQATDVEANFTTIYNDYNGNITNANIAAGAGIPDSKLATLSTYGKVSGAALTALASVNSAAGIMPSANLASGTTSTSVFLRGDLTWASVVTSSPTYFGSWVDKSSSYGAQQATTDGLVMAMGLSTDASGAVLGSFTDTNANPTTQRGGVSLAQDYYGTITMPVKKNNYWKVTLTGNATMTVYFISIGT